MWTIDEGMVHDFIVNLAAGLIAGFIIFIVGLYWRVITSYLLRERAAFRRLFGAMAWNTGIITVTLDTYKDIRILSQPDQERIGVQFPQSSSPQSQRFFKVFPDGHFTIFPGAWGDVLGYCSARAAGYLISGLRIRDVIVQAVSDWEVSSQWSGTSVNIGSSASNIKTNDIKHLPENAWLRDDLGKFVLSDGEEISLEERADKGIILKVDNPYFRGHTLFVCAGLGEWGTSGAAYFLSRNWRTLSRRFAKNSFLVVVAVTPGSDMSTSEILAKGNESLFWRASSLLRQLKRR